MNQPIQPSAGSPAPAGSAPRLTKEQAVIVSGFTGFLCCDFSDLHVEIERRLGRPVWTHELSEIMNTEVRRAFRDDFVALSPNAAVSDGGTPFAPRAGSDKSVDNT